MTWQPRAPSQREVERVLKLDAENNIRALQQRQRALNMGVPQELLDKKKWAPPRIEGVPPLPAPRRQEPQQIFPAPADFPEPPPPPLRSVLVPK